MHRIMRGVSGVRGPTIPAGGFDSHSFAEIVVKDTVRFRNARKRKALMCKTVVQWVMDRRAFSRRYGEPEGVVELAYTRVRCT